MKKRINITPIVLIAGFIICFAVRVYAIVACTDMKTGFLYHDSEVLCNAVYYGALILTIAGAVAAAHFDERKGESGFGRRGMEDITDARAAAVGFALLLMAVCAGYEGISEISAVTPSSFLMLLDIGYAVLFAAIAFVTLGKKEFKPLLGFSYAAGGIYFVFRGVYCFVDRMVIASVPEYLIECLSVIGGAVYFVVFAEFASGNGRRLTKKALCGWGAGTAVLTLSSSLATVFSGFFAPSEIAQRITLSKYRAEYFYQTNGGSESYMLAYTPFVNVAMAVFAVVTMLAVIVGDAPRSEDTSE